MKDGFGTIICVTLVIDSFESCLGINLHKIHVQMQKIYRKRDYMSLSYKSLDSNGRHNECISDCFVMLDQKVVIVTKSH